MFANEVLICFALPLHLGLHRVYHLFTTLIHQGALPPAQRCGLGVSRPSECLYASEPT